MDSRPEAGSGVSRPSGVATQGSDTGSGVSRPSGVATQDNSSGIARPGTTSGVSRPGSPVTASQAAAPAVPRSEVDRRIEQGQSKSALAAFRADQQKFNQPAPAPTPEAAKASPAWQQYGSRWNNYDQYKAQSDQAINRLPPEQGRYWSDPPSYVRSGPPAYGSYRSSFLASLLGSAIGSTVGNVAGNALWAYSHQNDPAYERWHADMTQKAENDSDLRDRLAQLDRQVNDLKEKQAAKSDALPQGVDPALAIAPHTVLAATTQPESHWFATLIKIVLGIIAIVVVAMVIMKMRSRKFA